MQTIYLDISNKGVYPCIVAKQSEVGRKFLAVITDGGIPYNIPENSLLSVWYEGDTDAGNYSSINEESAFSIDGNKVTVELVAQMLLQPGNGELCLSITHGDGRETNTWNIPYCVEYKPGSGSSVPTEYYTALTEAGAIATNQFTLAKQQAEIASQYANEAATQATFANEQANLSATYANDAKAYAESLKAVTDYIVEIGEDADGNSYDIRKYKSGYAEGNFLVKLTNLSINTEFCSNLYWTGMSGAGLSFPVSLENKPRICNLSVRSFIPADQENCGVWLVMSDEPTTEQTQRFAVVSNEMVSSAELHLAIQVAWKWK